MFLVRFLVFVLSFAAGLWIIRNSEWLVRTFGHAGWAERLLGAGGSYSVWKLGGIVVMILGFLYAVGTFRLAPEEGVFRPNAQVVPAQ